MPHISDQHTIHKVHIENLQQKTDEKQCNLTLKSSPVKILNETVDSKNMFFFCLWKETKTSLILRMVSFFFGTSVKNNF